MKHNIIRSNFLTGFFIVCCAVFNLEAAAENRIVKVGVFPAAPLVFEKKGQADGLFIDVLEQIAKLHYWELRFVPGTWNNLQKDLLEGKIDLLPAFGHTAERTERFDFSRKPLFIDYGVLFTKQNRVIHTIFDLTDKRVAGVDGSMFTTGFQKYIESFGIRCTIVNAVDNPQVMQYIVDDSVDAGICIYSLGFELAKKYSVNVTPISFTPLALHYATAKGRNADLIKVINTELEMVAYDPGSFYSDRFHFWMGTGSTRNIPSWIIWGTVGLLFIGLVFVLWTIVLQRLIAIKTKDLRQKIEERKNAELALKIDEARLESLLRILQHPALTIQELLDFTLNEVIMLTESSIGYIYLYDESKKEFKLNTWSKDVMHRCMVTEQQTVYHLDKTGIWGEAVRQRKPIIINDFLSPHPLKKGLPDGHVPLKKFLTIPVFDHDTIVAVVGVANKETDYTEADIRQLNLTMDATWKMVVRKQNEKFLIETNERLKQVLSAANAGTWEWEIQSGVFSWSPEMYMIFGIPLEKNPGFEAWNEAVHPDDRGRAAKKIQDAIEKKIELVNDYRVVKPDGSIHWIQAIGNTYYQNEKAVRMLGICIDITERKKSEELIKENYQRLNLVLSNLPIILAAFNMKGEYLLSEGRGLLRFGRKPGVLPEKNVFEIYKDRPEIIENLNRARAGETVWSTIIVNDQFLDVYYEPIKNINGEIEGFVSLAEIVTEKKKAIDKVIESEKRLQMVFEHSGTANAIFDTNFCLVYNNSMSQKLLKLSVSECVGKSVIQLFGEIPGRIIEERMKNVFTTGNASVFESEYNLPDGKKWFESSYQPLIDDNGKITGVQIVSKDITSERISSIALYEEKERLKVTLQSIGDGVITTNEHGDILMLNPVAEKLTEWAQEDASGQDHKTVFKLISEQSRIPVASPVEHVLSTGSAYELMQNVLLVAKDDSECLISCSGAPIRNNENQIIGVILVFRDITEKQRLIQTIQRTDKLESIGILAGGIAHDFNNLLGGIYGYIDMAIKAIDPNSKAAYYMKKSLNTFSRGRNLTRQLLTFAKGGAPDRKTIDIVPLLKESVEFALSGSKVASKFMFECNSGLCDVDVNQFGQVIDNMVINAVQAMPEGGTITIGTETIIADEQEFVNLQANKYIHISIRDTGVGISKKNLSKIFDPFFTTKEKGNGLGLATSYSIIRKHNGDIIVESEIGIGTTFHIYLPISENTHVYKEETRSSEHTGSGKVLVIDDEECIRDTVSDIIKSMGYAVEVSSDGRDVMNMLYLAKLSGQPFTAILTDLTIPGGIGGKELVEKIREEYKTMHIFVSSGYSHDPIMSDPVKYGFTDKLDKPFRKADLVTLFARYLK